MKVGDKIRVIRMDDSNGKDTAVHRMNGVIGTIEHIDGMGQIHLDGYGLAVIPEVDEFEVIEQ
jgi:hypothetical protein